jgi:hypothetical protein
MPLNTGLGVLWHQGVQKAQSTVLTAVNLLAMSGDSFLWAYFDYF